MKTTAAKGILALSLLLTLAGCGDSMLGKWAKPGGASLEFLTDDKLIYVEQPFGTIVGEWKKLDDTRVSIKLTGLAALAGEQICGTKLDSGRLIMDSCLFAGVFERAR